MKKIWANSPSDVYIGGFDAEIRGNMWHFDGENWNSLPLHISEGGPVNQDFVISDIYGFSENEIYAVGFSHDSSTSFNNIKSLILRWDGASWTREDLLLDDIELYSVWDSDPGNMWFGGERGLIINYVNSNWIIDSLRSPVEPLYPYPRIMYISGSGSHNPVIGMQTWNDTQLYRYEQNHWMAADWFEGLIYGIWTSPSENHYVCLNYSLQKWDGNSNPVNLFDHPFRAIHGTNDNDIFSTVFNLDGDSKLKLDHFNESDLREVRAITNSFVNLEDCWTSGEEVFVIGQSWGPPYKTVVYHGK